MRRVLAVAVVVSLVAVACGDDNATPIFTSSTPPPVSAVGEIAPYPQAVVDEYVDGCSGEADEALCRCTIDEFQQRLTLTEFLDLVETDLDTNPMVGDVIDMCLRTGDSTTTTTAPTAASTSTTQPEFTPITDIDTITELTVADLEAWWATELPAVFDIEYEPVDRYGPFFISQGDVPSCGGPLDRDQFEENAFYCSIDDTVQWDAETLMAPLFQEFGDYTVALVLAHEWGHAIQARYGFDNVTQPTIVAELQADCLAGAWTGRIAAEESDLLRLEPGDLEEGMAGFLLIGDGLGFDPSAQNAHGGSFDRLNAFFEGFNQGVAQCATYEDQPPPVVAIPLRVGEDPTRGGDLALADTAPFLIDALEAYWAIAYPEIFGSAWVPVARAIPYMPSTGDFPACGGTTLSTDFYDRHAFYCAADDYVAWDDEGLFPDLYVEIGDFAIGLILANEWGRAVQARAGLPIDSDAAQLQVDCLAGMWSAALVSEDNPTGIVLSAGDLEEGIAGFLTLSGAPGESGGLSAFDRFEAFKDGFLFGNSSCGL